VFFTVLTLRLFSIRKGVWLRLKKGLLTIGLTFGWMGLLAITTMVLAAQPAWAATACNYWGNWNAALGRAGRGENQSLAAEETAMLMLINRERVQSGLPQLEWDAELTELARAKSRDMVYYNYFGHLSERLGSVYDQLQQNGIVYRMVGENLVGAPGYRRAQQSIMSSPAHRGNILNANFTRIGIGVAAGGAYRKIFTQILVD
jgi:uncharacterized protein YkwD